MSLPAESIPTLPGPEPDFAELLRRRWSGGYCVDEWGLDPDLIALLDPAFSLRWNITVSGAEHVPSSGPVVLVVSNHLGFSEPLVSATGIRKATGRFVRFLGVPDVDPLGPYLRRLGGALGRMDELAGLLRAEQVVAVGLGRVVSSRRQAGHLPGGALLPALVEQATVLPVACIGREWGRRWRVLVGPEVPRPPGRSPLAVAELAEAAHAAVQELLDDAFPPRWPFG